MEIEELTKYDMAYLSRLKHGIIESRNELTLFLNEVEMAIAQKELKEWKNGKKSKDTAESIK